MGNFATHFRRNVKPPSWFASLYIHELMNIITCAFKPWGENSALSFRAFNEYLRSDAGTPVINMETTVDKPYKAGLNLHMNAIWKLWHGGNAKAKTDERLPKRGGSDCARHGVGCKKTDFFQSNHPICYRLDQQTMANLSEVIWLAMSCHHRCHWSYYAMLKWSCFSVYLRSVCAAILDLTLTPIDFVHAPPG